jgi:AbrB family looped-hinge helix DNA binding protein
MTLRKRVKQLEEKHKMFYEILKDIQVKVSGQNYDRQEETHFTRPIDELGRIVIPKELREKYQVKDGQDEFNIWTKGDYIVLKKQ